MSVRGLNPVGNNMRTVMMGASSIDCIKDRLRSIILPGKRIIVTGAPGSGKGTHSKELAALGGVEHISTGDLTRIKCAGDPKLMEIAIAAIKSRQLLSNDLIVPLLERAVAETGKKGVILDGFPRLPDQVQFIPRILGKVDAVIFLSAPDDLLKARMMNRMICRSCWTSYNELFDPPKVKGKCDHCGNELTKRRGDTDEVFERRMKLFRERTSPAIIALKRSEGRKFIKIDSVINPRERVADEYIQRVPEGGYFLVEGKKVLNKKGITELLCRLLVRLFETSSR